MFDISRNVSNLIENKSIIFVSLNIIFIIQRKAKYVNIFIPIKLILYAFIYSCWYSKLVSVTSVHTRETVF